MSITGRFAGRLVLLVVFAGLAAPGLIAQATHEGSPSTARFVGATGQATVCPADTTRGGPAVGIGGTCHFEPERGGAESSTVTLTITVDEAEPGQRFGVLVVLDDGPDRDRSKVCARSGEAFEVTDPDGDVDRVYVRPRADSFDLNTAIVETVHPCGISDAPLVPEIEPYAQPVSGTVTVENL